MSRLSSTMSDMKSYFQLFSFKESKATSVRTPLVVLLILLLSFLCITLWFQIRWTISLQTVHRKQLCQGSHRGVKEPSLQVSYNRDERTNKILSQSIDDPSLIQPEITVVTAFFNISSFTKGTGGIMYRPSKNMQWMKVFGNIKNNLVAYTDSKDVYDHITNLRRRFPNHMTKVFLIHTYSLWSFSLAEEIRSIYMQPNYPRHQPNTVNENYSCAMHAKFELVNKVLTEELFPTRYFCWLDVGYFRDLADDKRIFQLQIPNEWDKRKVAHGEISGFNEQVTIEKVVKHNMVWVGGGMFLGTREVLHIYTEDNMNTVMMLLDQRLMNTDQQVIYSLYLPSSPVKPRVQIQTFFNQQNRNDSWFYLGYLCRETWLNDPDSCE